MIEEFSKDLNSFSDYTNDNKTKSAIERQLAIIGEAINKFLKISQEEITESTQIINLRNRLIHAYDSIDDTIIWAILKKHLIPLKIEITEMLNK